jgi:hypothetical protein
VKGLPKGLPKCLDISAGCQLVRKWWYNYPIDLRGITQGRVSVRGDCIVMEEGGGGVELVAKCSLYGGGESSYTCVREPVLPSRIVERSSLYLSSTNGFSFS